MTAPSLVFFGDSLSDDGNLVAAGQEVFAPGVAEGLAGPTGAVSDGPTFATYAGEALGGDTENYAVAAAEAVGEQPLRTLVEGGELEDFLVVPLDDPALDFDINIGGQVDRFLADHEGDDLASTSAVLLIGGNDYNALSDDLAEVIAELPAIRQEIVDATLDGARQLAEAGLGTVTILTLPGPSYFPSSDEFSFFELLLAEAAFDEHNLLLAEGAEALAAEGFDVQVLDIDPITAAIADAPDAYGFVAPYTLTIAEDGALAEFDDEQVAFFDSIHPSTANHAIVGSFVAAVTEGAIVTTGTGADETILMGRGVDIVLGMDGDDEIRTKGGDDIVNGHDGDDRLLGGGGDDLLSGGAGADILVGHVGDDVLAGQGGNDRLFGREGDDVILDGLGADLAEGGAGDDAFVHVQDVLLGAAGDDGARDRIYGGEGFDTLYLVLAEEAFAAHAGDTDLLAAYGLRLESIEQIVVLDGLDALDAVEDAPWSEDADLWGLI